MKIFFVLLVSVLLQACATSSNISPVREGTYLVKKGETLYSIAWQAGIDYRTLAALNGIKEPYTIYPSQVIRLKERFVAPKPTVSVKNTLLKPFALAKGSRWKWPAKGQVRRPKGAQHKGIEILGRTGEPVIATAKGKVVYSGQGLLGYGNLIIIKHDDEYLSAYAHNQTLLAKEGDAVSAGQVVALMGSTGTDRVKLYFEMRHSGKPIDPLKLLSKAI